jgi:hypothetical protein
MERVQRGNHQEMQDNIVEFTSPYEMLTPILVGAPESGGAFSREDVEAVAYALAGERGDETLAIYDAAILVRSGRAVFKDGAFTIRQGGRLALLNVGSAQLRAHLSSTLARDGVGGILEIAGGHLPANVADRLERAVPGSPREVHYVNTAVDHLRAHVEEVLVDHLGCVATEDGLSLALGTEAALAALCATPLYSLMTIGGTTEVIHA